MAKEKKVEQITDMEVDFAQWYTDICRKAELVEYASVKGFTILRPYGYAIWENIQRIMDAEFKKTGHENVAMPVLIPESLLKKEGELVNGFAPEVAWVTMGGSEKLEERLAFRPTSETHVLRPLVARSADLPRAADALQPVVLRHPLGEDDPPVPAQPRVLVAGGPHHPRDRRGGHRTRPSSSSSATPISLKTSSPSRSCPARRPRRKSSPAPRRPTPSSA